MISSLLHLVGLGPRVYYTLTNFRGGGGGKAPLAPPQYANADNVLLRTIFRGIAAYTPQISCHLCDLVCFGVQFREFSLKKIL